MAHFRCIARPRHALAEAVLDRGWRTVVTARRPDSLSDLTRRYGARVAAAARHRRLGFDR
ncbi:hypothetical protein F01_550017 [Burkholderia cenocepacia]|nr:hypothetical protein F01_550017 [Burkholderia cenocepacia]